VLAVIICLVIPLAFGHWREAIAGTAALAVLWWRISLAEQAMITTE
jgi:hypothetical protein